MSNLETEVNYKINKLYDSNTLFKKYGLDVWITMTIIIILVLTILYYHMLNHLHSLRKDWVKIRCNPLYMPFAGYIDKDTNKNHFDSAIENFTYCMTNIIHAGTKNVVDPVYHSFNSLTNIFNGFSKIFDAFRAIFNYLRTAFEKIVTDIVTRLINICIPLMMIFVKLKDSFAKLIGILTASLFAFALEYKLIKIYILNIGKVLLLEVYIPLVIITAVTLATSAALIASFFGIPAGIAMMIAAIPALIVITILGIFLMILVIFENQVYKDITQGLPPKIPVVTN